MGGSPPPPTKEGLRDPPGGGSDCPTKFNTIVSAPAEGILAGEWLVVGVDHEGGFPRIVLTDEVTGVRVGSLAGVPNLDVLLRCVEDGVPYRAFVDHVDGGRVDITVVRR